MSLSYEGGDDQGRHRDPPEAVAVIGRERRLGPGDIAAPGRVFDEQPPEIRLGEGDLAVTVVGGGEGRGVEPQRHLPVERARQEPGGTNLGPQPR